MQQCHLQQLSRCDINLRNVMQNFTSDIFKELNVNFGPVM